eukprot:5940246-Ditylum_brightwellii.AAC.1
MEGSFCISKANSIGASEEKKIVITMAFAIMTPLSATLLNLARNTFSRRTILWNSRGSDRSCLLKMLRGVPRNLTGREIKDLNVFVKDKINETNKERDCNMHAMNNFKD